ncbi:MAG: DUF3298 domain-containing protein [Minisyncoccia bacterium]
MPFPRKYLALLVLFALIAGGLVWYITTRPAPEAETGEKPSETLPQVVGPRKVSESTELYEVTREYPGETPLKASVGAQSDSKAIESMKIFEENTSTAFKESVEQFGDAEKERMRNAGLKADLQIVYDTHASTRTISYVFKIFQDTLGAHPNTFFRTFTFDTKTGESLILADLFTPGANYLETLSTVARAKLPKIISTAQNIPVSDVDTEYIGDGTTPNEDNFQNFYFEGSNLVILFPPYQVGPYVLGIVTLPVPLAELKNILETTYR